MIRVKDLSKRFMIYQRPFDRLHDWLTPARLHRGRPFWALRDLTFDLPNGSSTGIVGVNGAGKSTLLKILTGTTLSTSGSFLGGKLALQTNAGYQMNAQGRSGANAVSLLSRAKIKF